MNETRDRKILADELVELKARVKAEMLRRSRGDGPVNSYGSSDWDYVTSPASDVKIELEHFDKNIEPLRAINTEVEKDGNTYSLPDIGPKCMREEDIVAMDAMTTLFATEQPEISSGTSNCSGSVCTGLCTSYCKTVCSSCTSACSPGCGVECQGKCGEDCEIYCDKACTCCTTTCAMGCENGCTTCWSASVSKTQPAEYGRQCTKNPNN